MRTKSRSFSFLQMLFSLSSQSFSSFSCRRTFFSMGADRDGAPIAGDKGSTSMSVLARDKELLVERNDIARLSLPAILLIFLQNRQKQHNSWNGIKMLVVSHPKVNCPEVSCPRLPSEYSNQEFGMSSTIILFNFLS